MRSLAYLLGSSLMGGLLLSPLAHAASPQWGGSATLSSNYLLRGVSRSSNDPALSAEAHIQFTSIFFASVGAITSRVQPGADTTPELNATLGIATPLGQQWMTRVSFTHYETPWSSFPDFYRYDELAAEMTYRDRWRVSASYSPNTSMYAQPYGPVWDGHTWAYETSYQHPLRPGMQAFAGAGYYDLSDLFGEGYWYGSVGASLSWRRWQLDLSWVMPESAAQQLSYAGTAEQRLLATLTRNF